MTDVKNNKYIGCKSCVFPCYYYRINWTEVCSDAYGAFLFIFKRLENRYTSNGEEFTDEDQELLIKINNFYETFNKQMNMIDYIDKNLQNKDKTKEPVNYPQNELQEPVSELMTSTQFISYQLVAIKNEFIKNNSIY